MDPSHPSSSSPPVLPHLPLQSQNRNPNSDLSTTLSLLQSLISSSAAALRSLSSLLSSSSSGTGLLLACPHDSRHRIPPYSLFRHYLRCSSSIPVDIHLQSLRYLTTLNSSQQQIQFPSDSDLCLSIDSGVLYGGNNFFYEDCPGVVSFPEKDESRQTFILPAFLASHSANFNSAAESSLRRSLFSVGILPSEFWALKSEVAAWKDFPATYSYAVLRVAACLDELDQKGFMEWVLSNSPGYGIVVDQAMAEHIALLLSLCLKEVEREATVSMESVENGDVVLDPRRTSFESPQLIASLLWLTSQLAILYGEMNGKLFAIGMLKESILRAGLSKMLFKSGKDESVEVAVGDTTCDEGHNSRQVLVSQIAASVAALHERSMLEERIKDLRSLHQIPNSQRLNEHLNISAKASEERKRRTDCRAVIEHDGFLWHQEDNQGSGKMKTREELLAEERDYKRRRMSYRGKTVKRTTIQVLRDIIEDHMEAIKKAGGIGCNLKVGTDAFDSSANWSSSSSITTNVHRPEGSISALDGTKTESPIHCKQQQANDLNKSYGSVTSGSILKGNLQESYQIKNCKYSDHHEDPKINRLEGERAYRSSCPKYSSSRSQFHERYSYRKEQDGNQDSKSKYESDCSGYSFISTDHHRRSTSTSRSSRDIENYRSKNRGRTSRSHRSDSMKEDDFEDRYNPY